MNPLETALEELNKRFISYCFEVESNVQLAVQSFLKTDLKSVQQVLDKDKEIDQMEITIEEECLKLLAVYQPLAKDLRLIVGILRMNNDLERIGDLAVNIVKKVTVFTRSNTSLSEQNASFFLPEMTKKVLDMLHKSIDAFIKKDPNMAREVCRTDDDVDALKQEMKIVVLSKMSDTREEIQQLSSVLRNSYHLERIADLATNIAEDVIYLVEGDIIRHNRLAEKKEN